MKTLSLVPFTRVVVLGAIACGCGADPSDDAEPLGVTTTELAAWADSMFMQTLRVDPGAMVSTIRNRCELQLRLPSAKPLTFIASESTGLGSSTVSVGWTGSAVSKSGLTVSDCIGSPSSSCNVTATYLTTAANGAAVACQMIADDGASRIVGNSSGNAMFVPAPPVSSVMFKQHVQTTSSGTGRTGTCIFRQNGDRPTAQVTGLGVFLNGNKEVDYPTAIDVGIPDWPAAGPSVPFGRISVGAEPAATRLRHLTPRNEQLGETDELRCAGSFSQSSLLAGFSVNTVTVPGNGMSITTEPTEWTCSPPKAFGPGNGCDCDCGVLDPVCGPLDCTHIAVTAPSFAFSINGVANNPAISLVKGRTYVFDVNTGIHPFAIHSEQFNTSTGVRYDDGVTGQQGLTSGQLQFAPPLAAPGTVYYQCELHVGMSGVISLAAP